jgi:lysine 2,3-aminomutase
MSDRQDHQFGPWVGVDLPTWNNWHWQLKNAIRSVDELNNILSSFTDTFIETSAVLGKVTRDLFEFKVTPHMVLSLKRGVETSIPNAMDAFRYSFVPSELEMQRMDGGNEGIDCIGEEASAVNPVPAITNFYKNRALFRVTAMCPAYCRYCFRRRMLGDGEGAWSELRVKEGLAYIADNINIDEVILSGGDPLVLSDDRLSYIVTKLKDIPHVKRLRIDTKALTMMPQRITNEFINILSDYQPFYLIGHFSHLYELTKETKLACERLANAGIPLGSHTPLLRGISDNEEALQLLMDTLVDCRVQPYYLINYIPTRWTEHFRVPVRRGIELVRHIFKTCGGLATPTYIVYLPDSGGKVPVSPQFIVDRRPEGYVFENMEGRQILYPEPLEN